MATGYKINGTDLDDLFEPAGSGAASTTMTNFKNSSNQALQFTTRYFGEDINNGYYKYMSNGTAYTYSLQDLWDVRGLIEGEVKIKHLKDATSIGAYAFAGCSSLVNVVGPSVTTIGSSAFKDCAALSWISFPACTSIHESAFYNCTGLGEVSFPECTYIGEQAFCTASITAAYFPKCTSIGYRALEDCSSLTTISFAALTSTEAYAFAYCRNLTSVSLPNCTTIDGRTFEDCYALSTISLPKVTNIGYYAFAYCSSLATIYIGTSNCTLDGSQAFTATGITSTTGHIYVPNAYQDYYEHAEGWSYFAARINGY